MSSAYFCEVSCALALLVTAMSCAKENGVQPGDADAALKEVSLTVTATPLSRAVLESGELIWMVGDSISVFDGYAPRVFVCTEGGAQGTFAGLAYEADSYSAVWPASSAFAYAQDKFSVRIPEQQAAKRGAVAPESYPMLGSAAKGEVIKLAPVAALVAVELAEGNDALTCIRVSSPADEWFCGNMVLTTSPADTPPVLLGTTSQVTMLPEDDFFTAGTYYMSVYPAALEDGLDVQIESSFYAPFSCHIDGVSGELSQGQTVSLGVFNPAAGRVEEEADDNSPDPASAYGYDFGSLATIHHPRLLMQAEDFVRLKKQVFLHPEDNETLVSLHNAAITLANSNLAKTTDIPLPEGAKGDVLAHVAREALGRLLSCSYAYRMTGENRYLTRAKADLARICSFENWFPKSWLSTAELMTAAAFAYDWLYYDLTLEERTAARTAIETLGLGSCPNGHYATTYNNWNQVCNAGLLCGAMAIYEKNKALAATHIDASTGSNLGALDIIYGEDGSYPEGYGYWEYGTEFQAILTAALLKAFGQAGGIESHHGLLRTGEYMLYMSDAVGTFPYSDGGQSSASPCIAQWWLASLTSDSSILANELRLLANGSYRNSTRLLPLAPCFLYGMSGFDPAKATWPTKAVWSGNGTAPMVMVRRGWNNDEGDMYLAMKGGAATTNHGHMDAGSFVYDRGGIRWVDEILLTGGYAPYENALSTAGGSFWSMRQGSLRWDVFVCNNLAHPTLSFANNDGSVSGKVHETDHCANGKATLLYTSDSTDGAGGTFDMSPVFAGQVGSATRQATLMENGDASITDIITALPGQDALLQWRAPTRVDVTVDEDCIELRHGEEEMYLWVQSSDESLTPVLTDFGNVRPVGQWGWTARDWDQSANDYHIVGYTLTIPAGRSVTLRTNISASAPGQVSGDVDNERPQM